MATSKIYLNPQAYGIGRQLKDLPQLDDANNATQTGFYATSSTTLNRPDNGGGSTAMLNVARGSYVFQFWFVFDGNKIYRRSKGEGTWTAWTEI